MDAMDETNFLYLNRENRWPDFESDGLDLRPDGAWQLAALPRLVGVLPDDLERLPVPDSPTGLAVGLGGAVYHSQPATSRLGALEPCMDGWQAVACLPGAGTLPGWLHAPRGLLYHPARKALLVADSSNSRIQLFDPQTWQVLDVWGRAGHAGAAPWNLHAPWSLAGDAAGNVYVADVIDEQQAQLLAFDVYGQPRPAFTHNVGATAGLQRPIGVATGQSGQHPCLFVLDAELKAVVVLDLDGHMLDQFGHDQLRQPLVIAASGSTVYIGDNGARQVLVFKPPAPGRQSVRFVGAAQGYSGPIAALAADNRDNLWLLPGGNAMPLRFDAAGAYAHSGVLWGGPFDAEPRSVRWHRLKAMLDGLADGAHVEFFVYGGDDPAMPPPAPDLSGDMPFSDDWRALPLDVTDGLIPAPPPRNAAMLTASTGALPPDRAALARDLNALPKEHYLWVGAHVSGEGLFSPTLSQIWLNYDHATYRQHLPAIFSRDPAQADLLDRLLGLFESFFDEAESHIRGLDRLFDPQAAPADWLGWLSGWVGLDLDENWPEAQQRRAVEQALQSYAQRGTAGGLRAALHSEAAVHAHIEEPLLGSDWWALATADDDPASQQVAVLGFTTRLAPTQAEGAVLGGSAMLDGSSLIDVDSYGAPLFENVAHQFTVQVHRGHVRSDADLERVRSVIEREKPAHTTYHLCVIEPRMRVGFQARLGIDTVVAGPDEPTALNTFATGAGMLLGGDAPGRIGARSQIGNTARLTTGSIR